MLTARAHSLVHHTLILQVCTAEGKKHVANFKT